MRYYTHDEIRAALARILGREPKEEVWERLVEEDYVREVWEETAEIDYLIVKYREFNRIPGACFSRQRGQLTPAPGGSDYRYCRTWLRDRRRLRKV